MVTDDKEITITDLILFLKKYLLIILITPIFFSLIVYFGSAFMPKYYSSSITFFTSTEVSGSSANYSPTLMMGGYKSPFDAFKKNDSSFVDISELVKSKRLLRTVAEKENIKDFYNTETNKAAASKLGKKLQYSIDDETSLEKLSFMSKDPVFTKKILDATFREIEILNDEIVSKKTQIKVKFFEDKIKETIEKLNESEVLIFSSKFKDNAFISLDPKNELGLRAKTYEQLRLLQSELEVKKNIYGEDSQLIQELRSKIKVLEKNSNLKPIDKEELENVKEWREIYRDYLYYSAALRSHINNFEISKLEEAGGTYLTMLDESEVLEKPNRPNRKKIFLISFGLTFFLTGLLVIIYDYFSRLGDDEKRKILGK